MSEETETLEELLASTPAFTYEDYLAEKARLTSLICKRFMCKPDEIEDVVARECACCHAMLEDWVNNETLAKYLDVPEESA